MTAYDASQWTDLFVASAGASAALAGLVFVAVSINVDRILKLEGVPGRARVKRLRCGAARATNWLHRSLPFLPSGATSSIFGCSHTECCSSPIGSNYSMANCRGTL